MTVTDAPRVEPAEAHPGKADLAQLGNLLGKAERPFAILGGSRWSAAASATMARFAERAALPVGTSFRRTDLFPADHPNLAGDVGIGPNPKLAARIRETDLLLIVGGRMSEMPSSLYSLLDIPIPKQMLVPVHADPDELGRVYQPTLAINATPSGFCGALDGIASTPNMERRERVSVAHQDYLDWSEKPRKLPGSFQYGDVMCWLRERLGPDAILTNGAGNFSIWLHRYCRFRPNNTLLAPTSGTMGYGVPAAVMAKRQHPERAVVNIAGDGDFLMNGQEFATAVQYVFQ